MAVTVKTNAPAEEAVEPQLIALELTRLGRYILIGDPNTYEKGIIYDFEAAQGRAMMRIVDDQDIPVFKLATERKVKAAEQDRREQTAADARRVRARANSPAPSPKPGVVTSRKAEPVIIEDDDPEIAERLKKIDDSSEGTGSAVAV